MVELPFSPEATGLHLNATHLQQRIAIVLFLQRLVAGGTCRSPPLKPLSRLTLRRSICPDMLSDPPQVMEDNSKGFWDPIVCHSNFWRGLRHLTTIVGLHRPQREK